MAARQSRAGGAPRVAGLTKTQHLRQAKTAAVVRQYEQKEKARVPLDDGVRRRVFNRPEPKKVDFGKPGVTKAMLARIKHAEKVKQAQEQKKQEEAIRRPRRTPAPLSGDASFEEAPLRNKFSNRLGRERLPRRQSTAAVAGPSRPQGRGAVPRRSAPAAAPIPQRTCDLARSMNAEVIQAEPIGDGPIDSIVIPPGAVSENRTTIVSIPQAPPAAAGRAGDMTDAANRSMQAIRETLEEQDIAEVVTVQQRLLELQQARRNFMMALANVGTNVPSNQLALIEEVGVAEMTPSRGQPAKTIFRFPDLEDDYFRSDYGLDHPAVIAAQEFFLHGIERARERERRDKEKAQRDQVKAERDLERFLRDPQSFYFNFNSTPEVLEDPFGAEELADVGEILDESLPMEPLAYESFDPEDLERFFNVEKYPDLNAPPCCSVHGPPPGRENLNPDLWELADPWYREATMSDLIDFETN